MTKSKKAIFGMLSMLLVAAVAVAGVVMWLTSTTSQVTNTFTVGNITATLDETDVDLYGEKDSEARVTANQYKLIPGHTYLKDPTVHIEKGSEKCWVFVKVVDGLANAEDATTIADQMVANNWVETTQDNVWAYETTVDALDASNDIDLEVFGSFKLKGDVDPKAYENARITIVACAVQADGFNTYEAALPQAKFE